MKQGKEIAKQIAGERIDLLFNFAEKIIDSNSELAHRYISSLKKISTHYKVKVPKKMKNRICSNCGVLLVPGLNSTVRVVSSHRYVAYVCNKCKGENHIPY